MKSLLTWILICCLTTLHAQQSDRSVLRYPAVAGSFYPAAPGALKATLEELAENAQPASFGGKVQSLIVPHAGYTFSGQVAASAYQSIPADAEFHNIFIIASSHREHFSGSSIYNAGNYITPLGEVGVNRKLATELIEKHHHLQFLPEAHDREHSIEVQLPFLQKRWKDLPPIIPIVMGSSSVDNARDLATALMPYYTPENLFVISSDFSHYPPYEEAVRVDRRTADAILTKDPSNFYHTLRKNSQEGVSNLATPCCGWSAVLTMLYMSERRGDLELSTIRYQNSGDVAGGDRSRVVGYWAIAAHQADLSGEEFRLNRAEKEQLLTISRETLEEYILRGQIPEIDGSGLAPSLNIPAGAFVSLYTGDRLRGCIGNFGASEPLFRIIQKMTVSAAALDRRFAAVQPPELEYIRIEISVLTPLKRIESIEEFELGRHGIYMVKDGKTGTYLPQVASGKNWTAEEFLGHCAMEKAGIGWEGWREADLYVYEAIVFGEAELP